MNYEEKKLIDELTKASKDCKDLIKFVNTYRKIPAEELKKLYKELKNYHKNRLKEIKSMKKPLNVEYLTFIIDLSEIMKRFSAKWFFNTFKWKLGKNDSFFR